MKENVYAKSFLYHDKTEPKKATQTSKIKTYNKMYKKLLPDVLLVYELNQNKPYTKGLGLPLGSNFERNGITNSFQTFG